MRILHCTDLHASDAAYCWLINQSSRYDLVCLSGDSLDLNPYRLPEGQIERVVARINQITVPVAICSGNHDNFPAYDGRLADARWMQGLKRPMLWMDGEKFEIEGHRFRIFPWMGAVPPSADQDEIWLMHAPPDLSPTSIVRGGVDFGDFSLGELCRSSAGPRLILSGHVHDRVSWIAKIGRTWCLNPGCDPKASVPNHIAIDLSRSHAVFYGSAESLGRAEPNVRLT
jgi:Icc-related predicted phosphoesterase